VAEPSTTGAATRFARMMATSRAWYRGDRRFLNEVSCSSSMTMSPRWGTGAKTATWVPTTTSARPWRMSRHSRCRSVSLRSLWRTATRLNRWRKRWMVWGVRAISGTRTMACRPQATTSSMARRYTSVFPDPVTPFRTMTPNVSAAARALMRWRARACSAVRWTALASSRSTKSLRGKSSTLRVMTRTRPFSSSVLMTAVVHPAWRASSRGVRGVPSAAARRSRTRRCFDRMRSTSDSGLPVRST